MSRKDLGWRGKCNFDQIQRKTTLVKTPCHYEKFMLLYLLEILEKILSIVKCYERCCTSRNNDDGSAWFWKKANTTKKLKARFIHDGMS